MPTHEDAEDVVQDAFLSAMRAIGSFDVTRPFGPWITRIVVNQGITYRRSRARRQDESMPVDLPSAGPSPALVTERNEITDRFRAALEQLPGQQRLMIQLFEVDGLSSPEIAKLTGLSDGTVRWHIHAARKTLRTALAPLMGDGDDNDDDDENWSAIPGSRGGSRRRKHPTRPTWSGSRGGCPRRCAPSGAPAAAHLAHRGGGLVAHTRAARGGGRYRRGPAG